MVDQSFRLHQILYKASHPPIHVTQLSETELTDSLVATFLQTTVGDVVGVATAHGTKGVLSAIAFSTPSHTLYVRMLQPDGKKGKGKKSHKSAASVASLAGRKVLLEKLLLHPEYRKLAIDMHRIATALFLDFGLTINRAIHLQSMLAVERLSLSKLLQMLGGEDQLHKNAVMDNFMGEAFELASMPNVCLRAWASCRVGSLNQFTKRLLAVPAIDTFNFNYEHLILLAKFVRDGDRLHALKPTKVKNDVDAEFSSKSGLLNVNQTRFKTRMRRSDTQKVVVEMVSKGLPSVSAQGRAVRVKGKSAQISVNKSVAANAQIRSVTTFGRDEPTPAEMERADVVLTTLQRKIAFFDHPLAKRIFFPSTAKPSQTQATKKQQSSSPPIYFPGRSLNISQAQAVRRILSDDNEHRVCLIHGPPGTGKTTVIAASVSSLMAASKPNDDRGVWLLAQSNVAVKNIAEKLADIGFWDFKLLVSKDFHFDWHEHLYEKIERHVIRSDDFADNHIGTERLLLGSKVILCTLSMLSHARLAPSGFIRLVPIDTVIVDEASQIELGDYLPMLGKFKNIRKVAFIGDDKQLAPYGQDDLGDLRSIFELAHLRKDAIFLDTQYRMPTLIGGFISRHIYKGRLQTNHAISTPLSCRLVDISHGKETKSGNSWINAAEADAVVIIARVYHAQKKSFRVITPYDAQRNLLEKKLKAASLTWENTCFNVDSFQGNEADHIIISVVRSDKVGFLTNLRRTNVMLSRCKKSMMICTSRNFLQGKASSSLVGKLAAEWGADSWLSWRDLLSCAF